jgi:hypothetical protein
MKQRLFYQRRDHRGKRDLELPALTEVILICQRVISASLIALWI